MELSILELGTLEVALEAYIEDARDSHKQASAMGGEADELAEFEVCVAEGEALLARVQTELKRK